MKEKEIANLKDANQGDIFANYVV